MRREIGTIGTFGGRLGAGSGFGGTLRSMAVRAFGLLITWQQRSRERHQLAAMDAYSLKDLGLSRADVAREADKPFWQA